MAQQKYSIIHKIDAGGMAEVWKGKATSLRGFEKLVAIKRVLPDLAKKENFISMFLDEARLSLHLNHANVVQTFDIGTSDNAYFIVMEWIDGVNLKGVLEGLKLNGERIPVEQAVFVAAETCKGLYHAHRRCAPDGSPLSIVHRDVSPPNLLISREGEVKLVDFGLAKAATQALSTEQGMVKGKFSYLSPEAAWGQVVDERADIFAVGSLLWEMLAGRRLFEGKTNKETVLMVREAKIPPLEPFNPYVDEILFRILCKALAKSPTDRYSNAKELGQDLSQYLFSHRLMVTNYDIAELVERTIQDRAIDKSVNPEWLDDVGQLEEQLVQFTSLEDLQRMSFRAIAEDGSRDARAVLPNAEDPRAWAAEMGLEEEFTLPPVGGVKGQVNDSFGQLSFAQTEQRVSEATSASYAPPKQHQFTPHSTPHLSPTYTNSLKEPAYESELNDMEETLTTSKDKNWIHYLLIGVVSLSIGVLLYVFMLTPTPLKENLDTGTKSIKGDAPPRKEVLKIDEIELEKKN